MLQVRGVRVDVDGVRVVALKTDSAPLLDQLDHQRKGVAAAGCIDDHVRATGDVLVDQLAQMQRSGFTSAVLRADQDMAVAQRQLDRYAAFYQGDAVTVKPIFAREGASA